MVGGQCAGVEKQLYETSEGGGNRFLARAASSCLVDRRKEARNAVAREFGVEC